MMKKILTLLLLMATTMVVQAQCNWTGYWMKKVNQQQNVYTFRTNIDWNSCINYWWIVYDHQLKKYDTLQDMSGFTQVQFNSKGKYTMSLKVVDICKKCDTVFNYLIDVTIYGKADVSWKIGAHQCKYHNFEMTEFDTCVEYYYTIYKSKYFDTMSSSEWREATDSVIYFGYNFDEKDLVYYNTESKRTLTHEFKDSGRHLVVSYWYNRCTGIDTWMMKKIEVCPKLNSTGITKITKEERKLIGIYDMMGRRVYAIRKNEILIYIYDDGTRMKVIQE